MSHGGGAGGDGALAMVPVETSITKTDQPELDVAPFFFFQKNKAPELLDCHACHLPLKPPIYKVLAPSSPDLSTQKINDLLICMLIVV